MVAYGSCGVGGAQSGPGQGGRATPVRARLITLCLPPSLPPSSDPSMRPLPPAPDSRGHASGDCEPRGQRAAEGAGLQGHGRRLLRQRHHPERVLGGRRGQVDEGGGGERWYMGIRRLSGGAGLRTRWRPWRPELGRFTAVSAPSSMSPPSYIYIYPMLTFIKMCGSETPRPFTDHSRTSPLRLLNPLPRGVSIPLLLPSLALPACDTILIPVTPPPRPFKPHSPPCALPWAVWLA